MRQKSRFWARCCTGCCTFAWLAPALERLGQGGGGLLASIVRDVPIDVTSDRSVRHVSVHGYLQRQPSPGAQSVDAAVPQSPARREVAGWHRGDRQGQPGGEGRRTGL